MVEEVVRSDQILIHFRGKTNRLYQRLVIVSERMRRVCRPEQLGGWSCHQLS